jgi:hypothetical protein
VVAIFLALQHLPLIGSEILRNKLDHESFPTEGINPAFFSPPPWFWTVFTPEINPVRAEVLNAERDLLIGILLYTILYEYILIYYVRFSNCGIPVETTLGVS